MANITPKGRVLALELELPGHSRAAEVCSLIVRDSISFQRVAEAECNGPPEASSPTLPTRMVTAAIERHQAWCERRSEQLAKRITKRTAELAKLGAPVSGVDLGGDPRGVCVKLIRTDGRSNSWSGESRWSVPI